MNALHRESVVIDGLIISKWDRSVFEDMRRAGLTAANCTVSVWEGFAQTVDNIAAMKQLIRQNEDLLTLVRGVQDIRRAKAEGGSASSSASRTATPSRTAWATSKPSPTWACASSSFATTRRT